MTNVHGKPVGAVIGREGVAAVCQADGGALFAATDRSHSDRIAAIYPTVTASPRSIVGAVIGREGVAAVCQADRGALFAAPDRSHSDRTAVIYPTC